MNRSEQKSCIDCGTPFKKMGNKLRCTRFAHTANRMKSINAQQKNEHYEKPWIVMARFVGRNTNNVADRTVPGEAIRYTSK